MDVLSAAQSGNRLQALIALRDTLANAIDTCESMRDLSSLSRQMADVLAQIAELAPEEKKGDAVDEIAQRRAARRSGATKGQTRSKRPS